MKPTLSPGRARGLQVCAKAGGIFAILAVDHRDALRVLMSPEAPERVSAGELAEWKLAVTRRLGPDTSAVLLDPIYGAAQAIAEGAIPGRVGLLCALEEEGYLGGEFGRQTAFVEGWSVEKAKRLGANAVKVLLFYNPDAGAAAAKQEEFVRMVLQDCQRYDIPLFLEPMSYSLDPDAPKGSAAFASRRRGIVVESVQRLGALGPDVLKVEFPVDAKYETNQTVWREACRELDQAARVPWALLSAGEPFGTFEKQLRVACEAGCSGFVAGRSVWSESAALTGPARDNFLERTARSRFASLAKIAEESGRPWQSRYAMPQPDERWYLRY